MVVIKEFNSTTKYHFLRLMREKNVDLTLEMVEILRLLWDNGQLNQQEIVQKTNRSKASITSIIHNMEKRGLLERSVDMTDKRNNVVKLTAEGIKFEQIILPIVDNMYSSLYSVAEVEEVLAVTEILKKLEKELRV